MDNEKKFQANPLRYRRIALLLVVLDVAGLFISFNIASAWRLDTLIYGPRLFPALWPTIPIILSLYVMDTYNPKSEVASVGGLVRAMMGIFSGVLLVVSLVYLFGRWGHDAIFNRGVFFVAVVVFATWALAWRRFIGTWVRIRQQNLKWLVLGAGEKARLFRDEFNREGEAGELVFLDDDNQKSDKSLSIAGAIEDLDRIRVEEFAGIVVSTDLLFNDRIVQKLLTLRLRGLKTYDLTDFYESRWFKVPVYHLHAGWFVFAHGFVFLQNKKGYRLKRLCDTILALMLSLILLPLMIAIALSIRVTSSGPAIYRQQRKGEHGKIFTLVKYRTMRVGSDTAGEKWTNENDDRITPIGRILRKFRLDELPQLLNILRGEMSFIGPRPEAVELSDTFEREIPFYDIRYLVKPGISGWAQVMYPYGSSIEDARQKLQYDIYYIKNYSLALDLTILIKTLRVVILGGGR